MSEALDDQLHLEERDGHFQWVDGAALDAARVHQAPYVEAVPRYMKGFAEIFRASWSRSEMYYWFALLGIYGTSQSWSDPFETSTLTIPAVIALSDTLDAEDYALQRTLRLWAWGHMVEASQPLELLANLLRNADTGRHFTLNFPANKKGAPQSRAEKCAQLLKWAKKVGFEWALAPLDEVWDKALRNAVFHSDYAVHGQAVTIRPGYRLRGDGNVDVIPSNEYPKEALHLLYNRTLAYFNSIARLRTAAIRSYTVPVVIEPPPGFTADATLRVQAIVREGHGLAGIQGVTPDGRWRHDLLRVGSFTQEEWAMLNSDHALALLPARKRGSGPGA